MGFLTRKNKKIIAVVAIVAAVLIIIFVGFWIHKNSTSLDCGVQKNQDGSVGLQTNLSILNKKNINLGDSLNVVFDSGYNVEDVALVNGPILNCGNHICVANSDDTNLSFQIQNAENTWLATRMTEDSVAHISLREKAKFKYLVDAFSLPINQDQKDFRSLRGGNLRYLDIFRGVNPLSSADNANKMPYYFANLGVSKQINLSDNKYNIKYFDIKNSSCNSLVIDTLLNIANDDSHVFVCSDNWDLTAYFCVICEAIAGASYDEIVNDYMETYKNFYGITLDTQPDLYYAIKTFHLDVFLHQLTKTPSYYDLSKCDFAYDGEMYLRIQQLHNQDIEKIKKRLTQ